MTLRPLSSKYDTDTKHESSRCEGLYLRPSKCQVLCHLIMGQSSFPGLRQPPDYQPRDLFEPLFIGGPSPWAPRDTDHLTRTRAIVLSLSYEDVTQGVMDYSQQ